MPKTYLEKIAIAGATGRLGKPALEALIAADRFDITVLSRAESTSPIPKHARITALKVNFDSTDELTVALQGHDALVMTTSAFAGPELQIQLCQAAAAANVSWVIPSEFGSDRANPAVADALSIFPGKERVAEYLRHHESTLAWTAIISNPWFDLSNRFGMFGIDIAARRADLYDGGNVPINTTTMSTVALTIARLLALPMAELEAYRGTYCYIRSFRTTQLEMLAAFQRATGTTAADWTVTHSKAADRVARGKVSFEQGNLRAAGPDIVYGMTFQPGVGNEFESVRPLANEKLGLPKEDLDEAARAVVASLG